MGENKKPDKKVKCSECGGLLKDLGGDCYICLNCGRKQ